MKSKTTKAIGGLIVSLCVAITASLVASFASPALRTLIWSRHSAPSSQAASALDPAWERNAIKVPDGKCVDVLGNDDGGNASVVDLWDCQPQALDQRWQLNADGSLETLGRCLAVDDNLTTPGTVVQIRDCDGAGGQRWVPQKNGTLLNPRSGLCLGDPDGDTANGTQLEILTCQNTAAEHFMVRGSVPPAPVIAAPGDKCADVLGNDNGGNGAVVDLWDCQPQALDQHWYHNPDGTLETLGRCLAVSGNLTAPGTTVHLWNCGDSTSQVWEQRNGELVNPRSGLCLDDASNTYDNGTPLQIEPCDGSGGERFDLG